MTAIEKYFMEDPREAQRLTEKVDTADWVNRYLNKSATQAKRVLDVGCGSGVILAELARRWPGSSLVGIDGSLGRLMHAREALAHYTNASAESCDATNLHFADDSFDLVYSRFLLEYLAERKRAVHEMVRVCRPGGEVLLQDLDGQLVWHHPADEPMQSSLERVIEYLGRIGFDPFVGRKLFQLAQQAGLEDITVQIEPYHQIAGAATNTQLYQWQSKLDIARPTIAKALGSLEAADQMITRFLDFLRRADTLSFSLLFTVRGTKPALKNTLRSPRIGKR